MTEIELVDPRGREETEETRLAPRVHRAEALREGTKGWVAAQGLKFPQLFQPLRCALTGKAGGPDLFDIMQLLGASRTLARIETGIERLGASA